jgi:hypothetical protein
MFIYDSDTRIMLFNEFSFESDEQFELYGVISLRVLHNYTLFYDSSILISVYTLILDRSLCRTSFL